MDTPDPRPLLREARLHCPIGVSAPLGLDPRPRYNVTRWDDVKQVLEDPETFSSAVCAESLDPFMGESILGLDGQAHRFQRGIVAHAFRTSALDRWEEELIGPIITDLLDAVAPRGRCDLRSEVLIKFPVRVICGMYGVPLEDAGQFQQWTDDVIHGIYNPEPAFAAKAAMRAYLQPILDDRRTNPRDDLFSDLLKPSADGRTLTEEQIWGTLALNLVGGTDTTYHGFGSMLFGILSRPDLYRAVAEDRSLIPELVEEALRWEAPAQRAERITTRDTTVGGCPIPAGSSINVWLGSANRDEARFESSDEMQLGRSGRRHMTFGYGPHQCLGIHLARRELRVGLAAVLDALPNLRFDPDQPTPELVGTLLRGPSTLPVVWDPRP